ncbi:MAG: phosphatidate cytidylyltransferase [Gemmatimonadales bacterium]
MTSNLARRIAFAAVAIPAVLVLAWTGGWAFALLLAVAGALGAREVYVFARAQGIQPLGRFGMVSAAALPFVVRLTQVAGGEAMLLIREGYLFLAWLLVLLVVALSRREPDQRPLGSVAVTVFGVLYSSWLLSFALLLRHPLPGPAEAYRSVGLALLVYPLALTWLGDTLAMAGGKTFGGPKLAPVISPNKTWAGGISGLLGAVAVSLIYAAVVFRRVGVSMSVGEAIWIAICLSLAGQLGDAVESLFKREVGLKDSSQLIPGHGGVLDRLDSLYFVLPTTVLLYRLAGIT